eukprot:33077-Rhodomonas_salina.5
MCSRQCHDARHGVLVSGWQGVQDGIARAHAEGETKHAAQQAAVQELELAVRDVRAELEEHGKGLEKAVASIEKMREEAAEEKQKAIAAIVGAGSRALRGSQCGWGVRRPCRS